MGSVAIHCASNIQWHLKAADKFKRGLSKLGIPAEITPSSERVSDVAILLGTTMWRAVEDGDYLLVDRASFKDPDFVSLVWNGHGRHGDHMVPAGAWGRWGCIGTEVAPWKTGSRIVLCGQTETWTEKYPSLSAWYKDVPATHFRSHPSGDNPTGLARVRDWEDAKVAVTLNSSVAIDALFNGVPAVTMDSAAMAWDVTSHDPNKVIKPDLRPWLEWLSWTQWHWQEIEAGIPAHLFEAI